MISDGVYLDNDVLLKMCTYLFADELIQATTLKEIPPAILGVAKFTLRTRVERSRSISNREAVRVMLEGAFSALKLLEPTANEIELAAEFEQQATKLGFEFDVGESQLFAMLLERKSPLLITGDKRAIRALSKIAPQEANQRLASFEQLIATVISNFGYEQLRRNVCAEREADRTMTICFACSSPSATADGVMEGLMSYVHDIRKESDRLLIPHYDISAVISQEYCERVL